LRILYVTLSIVFIDQITKLLIKGFAIPWANLYHEGMYIGQSIPVLGDFLRITYIENPGMAFGIEVSNRLILTLLVAVAICLLFYYLYTIRSAPFLQRLPFAMILGGAIGNFIDRVFYGVIFGEGTLFHGRVVDFIDVDFFNINLFGYHIDRWAVFNIADASVTVGIILMLFTYKSVSKTAPEPEQHQELSASDSLTSPSEKNDQTQNAS
jgi:signal peptidase II